MVTVNLPFQSLKLDYETLVVTLENLIPQIEDFVADTAEKLEKPVAVYSRQFAEVLGLSEDDSYLLCLLILTTGLMLKKIHPTRDREKLDDWLQKLWGKEK